MIINRYLVAAGLILAFVAGCSFDTAQKGWHMKNYYRALGETNAEKIAPLKEGSAEEKRAIDQFRDFYRVFSEKKIRESIRALYGRQAYFRDGFREVEGIDAIEKYFLSSTEAFHECTFDIQDVAVHEGNYYFRWIMTLVLKRDKEDRFQAVGMSHVRFDQAGKITFHQDYWDTGIIYEKAPVLGSIITWIRQRI